MAERRNRLTCAVLVILCSPSTLAAQALTIVAVAGPGGSCRAIKSAGGGAAVTAIVSFSPGIHEPSGPVATGVLRLAGEVSPPRCRRAGNLRVGMRGKAVIRL